MPLGMEVGLGPGHIVLDGNSTTPKGTAAPLFGPCLLAKRSPISATTDLLLKLGNFTVNGDKSANRQPVPNFVAIGQTFADIRQFFKGLYGAQVQRALMPMTHGARNWRRFVARLSYNLVPNFSGAIFWSRIENVPFHDRIWRPRDQNTDL